MSLTTGAFLIVVLTAIAAFVPVPYVVLSPGPTYDTLGRDGENDVITIQGHQTYASTGHLQMLTVSLAGGPGRRMDLVSALRAWFDPHDAVIPTELEFPGRPSEQQVQKQNAEDMALSQNSATTAALTELGIPIRRDVVVKSVAQGAPALGVLKAGDVITVVDAVPATTPDAVRAAIQKHAPGDPVQVTVRRGGSILRLAVPTRDNSEGKALIGIEPAIKQTYPFDVKISLQGVGGPSAGLMFALGIIDKLTPGPLTGGVFVAGTGTIDDAGTVGAIGGIAQKLAGARRAGATVFLAPAANCGETHGNVPAGLQVVKVATLKEAVADVTAIGQQRTDSLPRC